MPMLAGIIKSCGFYSLAITSWRTRHVLGDGSAWQAPGRRRGVRNEVDEGPPGRMKARERTRRDGGEQGRLRAYDPASKFRDPVAPGSEMPKKSTLEGLQCGPSRVA
jgi:hypothetical protein